MPKVCVICGDDGIAGEIEEPLSGGFLARYYFCRKHYKEHWTVSTMKPK